MALLGTHKTNEERKEIKSILKAVKNAHLNIPFSSLIQGIKSSTDLVDCGAALRNKQHANNCRLLTILNEIFLTHLVSHSPSKK